MFGENLKKIRKEKGMTQKELAEKIETERSMIALYETGRNEPKIKTLKKICEVLECSADKLIMSLLLIINVMLATLTFKHKKI